MKYRGEIDGLRAVAVLPVLFFHAGVGLFSGGYVGVDVFFVISGYLITTIILSDLASDRFSLVTFYERRARRILPALFVVIAVSSVLAWAWLLPQDLKDFSQSVAAVSLFSSNILFWREAGYFDTASELKPLLHTWSLGIEEQFYLFFPLFVLLVWRVSRLHLFAVIAVAALSSFFLALWGVTSSPSAAYFLLPTRAWELAIGALVAVYLMRRHAARPLPESTWLAGTGIVLIAGSVVFLDHDTPYPSVYALAPTLGTALLILYARPTEPIGRFLSMRPWVTIGLISYSAYLWHQPLIAFAKHRALLEPSSGFLTAVSLASLPIAYASWRYVERPFRRKNVVPRSAVFAFALLGTAAFATIGIIGHAADGFPGRIEPALDAGVRQFPGRNNGWCFYSVDSEPDLQVGADGHQCILGDRRSKIRGLLFGDSFAGQYEPLWHHIGNLSSLKLNVVTTNWCFPSAGRGFTGPLTSRAFEQCTLNRRYLAENIGSYDFFVLAGNWAAVNELDGLADTIAMIRSLGDSHKPVIIMASPKIFDHDIGRLYQKSQLFHAPLSANHLSHKQDEAASNANRILAKLADEIPNVWFVPREAMFLSRGLPSDWTEAGFPFSYDGRHLSVAGSIATAQSLARSGELHKLVAAIKGEPR